jgi:two-component system chemotaxis response regulator CheB
MPTSALKNARIDAALPLQEIPDALTMFVGTHEEGATSDPNPPDSDLESGFDLSQVSELPGSPSIFRWPECGGSLWELEDGDFRGVLRTAASMDNGEAADVADEASR